MISTHYPQYDEACPPDIATLGAAYDELRDDAIRLEAQVTRLREWVAYVGTGVDAMAAEAHALLKSLAREDASLHCAARAVRITDRATGDFYYATEPAACRPQHEEGFRVALANGCSCIVGNIHYQF